MDGFGSSQSIVMLVCAFWHDVVLEREPFGADYNLLPCTFPVDIQHFNNRQLELRVYLEANLTPWGVDSLPPGRLTIHDTAVESALYASNCSRLQVTADEADALPTFMAGLQFANGTNLVSLSVSRLVSRDIFENTYNSLPHPIFNSDLPLLRFIRLVGFVLSWTDLVYFIHAIFIVFHRFTEEDMIPTWMQFTSVFIVSSNTLTRLSLRHFSCGSFDHTAPIVCLPCLVELDFCFCGANTVAFLSTCSLPALTGMTIVTSSSYDLPKMEWFGSILPTLTSFTVSGKHGRLEDVYNLMATLTAVTILNLSDAGSTYVNALNPGRSHGQMLVCPHVSVLSVGDCTVSDARDMVSARLRMGSRLALLNLHDIIDCDEEAEDWIGEHVDEMMMEPAFQFNDAWIWQS
ncbi:hypothetical protein C8F04DRAFT_1264945 [Mycena alexandri]|uniref:Uncharacterized protein n=1 Tax=Mycena alexandri TaxID=1745969 RepID=A0AAD6SPL5_9AGAR|nr:hypothetical protein C8F04DRAFT_1264945 [Mycena alexandri]